MHVMPYKWFSTCKSYFGVLHGTSFSSQTDDYWIESSPILVLSDLSSLVLGRLRDKSFL